MGIFSRILGICKTKPPVHDDCWSYEEGNIRIDLARAPELAEVGGAVRLAGKGLPVRVLVMRAKDDRFRAFENRCTHMGRRLDPLPDQAALQCCSVSKSTFDEKGEYISGPVEKALTPFEVTHTADHLEIKVK